MFSHRTETRRKIPLALKSRLGIRTESLPSQPLALPVRSISHYKTIIPIAIPIIPKRPDCELNAVAEPVVGALATAEDVLLAREETTDPADVAATDAPDLAVLVAVVGDMVPMVPLGRTRSTPEFLQSFMAADRVAEEGEVRSQYGLRLSMGREREFYEENRDILSISACEQSFDTSGMRVVSQSELLQIHFRSVRVHLVLPIPFKAAV